MTDEVAILRKAVDEAVSALEAIGKQDYGGLQANFEDFYYDEEDEPNALKREKEWHNADNSYLLKKIAARRTRANNALDAIKRLLGDIK